ncbi:MAG: alpha/beta fold hydrolase [Alphaproteobacteria bacterium]|nr:alpha/beta fold hydrolase [Alphaproteobacteria bacterium]
MKNAVLFHGMGRTPEDLWYPWLRAELEAEGFAVSAPQLPDAENPDLEDWTSFALETQKFDARTIIVGHSAGCPLVLSVLEKLAHPVHRAILVAGYIRLPEMEDDNPMLLQSPNWERMKHNGREFFFFNSDNDPWGCDLRQGEALRERLGGTLIIQTGEGHFGSEVFDQPYETFPLLKDICMLV